MRTLCILALFFVYVPVTKADTAQIGQASWYGREWTTGHGHRGTMANGRKFDPAKFSAASYAYPLGTILLVTNAANGKQVAVMVTDRGPARRLGRLLDLSEAAADALGYHRDGIATVSVLTLVPAPARFRYFRTIAKNTVKCDDGCIGGN